MSAIAKLIHIMLKAGEVVVNCPKPLTFSSDFPILICNHIFDVVESELPNFFVFKFWSPMWSLASAVSLSINQQSTIKVQSYYVDPCTFSNPRITTKSFQVCCFDQIYQNPVN